MNDEQVVQHAEVFFRDGEKLTFEDIIGYQLGSGFIGVLTREGRTHIYPSDRVYEFILTAIDKE